MFRFGQAGPIVLLSAGLVALGCSDRSPTSPRSTGEIVESPTVTAASAAATPDVSGEWSWSNVEKLKFPPFVALALGLVPEGDNTHARCESAGTMELVQSGSSFQGTAEKVFNACMTRGGQPFQQPQSELFVEDGNITGGSAHFSFASATVRPCPHSANIRELSGSVATELSGTGFCYLPSHPQSESPSNPPGPAGTTKTLSWQAHR